MASRAINMIYTPLTRPVRGSSFPQFSPFQSTESPRIPFLPRWFPVMCSAIQETSAASSKTGAEPAAAAAATAAAAAPKSKTLAKPKKDPVKSLPELMEEEVIPSLKATLEAEEEVTQIELSFSDNKLEGSFSKKDVPYLFWVFFLDGTLMGPKGFSLSSYGSGASTIEPFLIDERKITARHVVFWVEKRLAAQGILPVWKEE